MRWREQKSGFRVKTRHGCAVILVEFPHNKKLDFLQRIVCFLICLLMLFSFVGCDSDTTPVLSGSYYAVGDYEEMLTLYLSLDTDNNEFRFGAGSVVSYVEYGSYKIADGKIIATSQSTTFKFEIKDKNTLVLIDNGDNDYFKIPVNTQFIYSEDLK